MGKVSFITPFVSRIIKVIPGNTVILIKKNKGWYRVMSTPSLD